MPANRTSLSDRLARFPRLGLATLPTPLEPMKRLTAHLGGPRLWVKREDATGLGFAEIARYNDNPNPVLIFMAKRL